MAAGLTQEELAERTGMSVRAIGDIERGRTARPRRSSVTLLAQTLRLTDIGAQLSGAAGQQSQNGNAPRRMVPRQLPAGIRHFVGRTAELAALTHVLDDLEDTGGAVAISAVGGTAGVGKTALAVRWAHLVADRFPDGQLYVNLRGYDPSQPVTAADALAGFLRALGVPGQDVPADAAERAAQYRTLLAGRRMLVMLDNASEVEQVKLLLPGAPGCAAVITSRDSLTSLAAQHDARRLDLDLLPPQDALDLLRALIGRRVDADPGAAATLAERCSRLPLALRVAAELAVARPATPLTELAGELADLQQRLDLLDSGDDPHSGVRAVFSWSCRHLNADGARLFRLLGLHPGPDIDRHAAAELAGLPAGQERRVLDRLVCAHLVQLAEPGRYSMHDLLRSYARELAVDEDSETERRAALTRLFDHYLYTATAATGALFPADRHRRPGIPGPTPHTPPVADHPDAGRDWLDAERANLIAMAAHAAAHGWPGHAISLAATLFRYLDAGGYFPEAATIHAQAHRAAVLTGDQAAEATSLINLGVVSQRLGHLQQATGHLEEAAVLARRSGDRTAEARALSTLGNIELRLGSYPQAACHHQQALALHRQVGDQAGQACALVNLGIIDMLQGHYQEATERYLKALALHRLAGNQNAERTVLINLGDVYRRQGHYQQAADQLQQALTMCRETGDRFTEAHVLTGLGDVDQRQGRYRRASDHHKQALDLCRRIGDRSGEAESLNGLGEVLLATGQAGPARARHEAALDLAGQVGDKYEQARSHDGLARSYHGSGDHDRARHHWRAALALYAELAVPEVDEVRARLAAADQDGAGTG